MFYLSTGDELLRYKNNNNLCDSMADKIYTSYKQLLVL